MANLKNINLMSQDTFESIETADDELYAVSASGIGFPSNRYEDLVLGANVSTYTAPANGYFMLEKVANSAGQMLSMGVPNCQRYSVYAHASGNVLSITLPVKKGQGIYVSYSVSGTTKLFRFIYAEGE